MQTFSRFSVVLQSLLDDTGLCTRVEWAQLLFVPEDVIVEWLADRTLPRADVLCMIVDLLQNSQVPQEPVSQFLQMAELPATDVSPHGPFMLPTVAAFMRQHTWADLGRQVRPLGREESNLLLESCSWSPTAMDQYTQAQKSL